MNDAGWIVLGLSLGGFLSLFIFCMYKVLRTPHESQHIEGFEKMTPLDDAHSTPLEPPSPQRSQTAKTLKH